MGKGDKKTKRGKITIGSYGKTRPRKKKNTTAVKPKAKPAKAKVAVEKTEAPAKKATTAKKSTTKKTAAKKAE
jgi:30S ribosomal protein S31